MKKSPRRRALLAVTLAYLTLAIFSGQAMAREYTYSGSVFRCLQKKWPDIQSSGGGRHVFIPETGQNLAWDNEKLAWIDVKTGGPVWGDVKTLAGALFCGCLQHKWPDAQSSGGGRHVFIPETGQNLAWDNDKQAWIDVKTGKCICPECPPSRTAQEPTPSTTDKVTDVLKTIGNSVSVSIGGGGYTSGHNERHHGEDRHRTADKVSTDKTKTHTTSPTTTGHKTVTAGCKCHPCTCSPCTCH